MKTIIAMSIGIIMTFIVTVSAMGGIIPDGLVAYWGFNNCDTTDDSGNGHFGTIIGDPDCIDGIIGKAFEFDGIDDLVEIPDDPVFHFTNQMTAAAWVKPSKISGGRNIVSKAYAMDTFSIGIENDNFIFVVVFPGGDWGQPERISAPATVGTWTHVAGVFDGQNIFLYINGQLMASKAVSGTLQDSIRPITIGNHPSWSAFEGLIDEVLLYNRPLSASEIQELFKAPPFPVDDTMSPTGAIHAYPNIIKPPNSKMVTVTFDGYVKDELSIARDKGGSGVSSAYLMVNNKKIILRDATTDLLSENGSFSITTKVKAAKGATYNIKLYATDTEPEETGGPNSGVVDSTYIKVPRE